MQSTNRHCIKLLITLVLITVAMAAAWTPSHADARVPSGPPATNYLEAASTGGTVSSGDPDIGQGVIAPPASVKQAQERLFGGFAKIQTVGLVVRWTGRIWATLYLRVAH